MAKQQKKASVHSRASRRAASPSIDTDKSLKNIKPPQQSSDHRPSILAIHQNAGVTKKSKIGRKSVLSARARMRQEKGLDRAEAVMDKKETKIEKSKDRARNVQDRARAWEEQNKRLAALQAMEEAAERENWTDEDEEVEDADAAQGDVKMDGSVPTSAAASTVVANAAEDDEEEIL